MSNVSSELIWAITKKQNAFLVTRRSSGGVAFSRDPLNVTGENTPVHSGLVNNKAIGVSTNANGSIQILKKVAKYNNKPAKNVAVSTFKQYKSQRKTTQAVGNATKKYRTDLQEAAVIKASALLRARKAKKVYPKKVRGGN